MPLTIFVILVYLVRQVGHWAVIGWLALVLILPVQIKVSRMIGAARRRAVRFTDERVATMQEILRAMKLVKLYAWEEPFAKKLAELRRSEVALLRRAAIITAINSTSTVLFYSFFLTVHFVSNVLFRAYISLLCVDW